MAQISFEQNNLIGGVSQQPDAIRTPNQCADMVNCWPSPVHGLVKRMPSVFLGDYDAVPDPVVQPTKYHTVHRDSEEQYQLIVNASGIKAYNLQTGATAAVTDPGGLGYGYLGITEPNDLKLLTVDDTTFILNTYHTAALDSAVSASLTEEAMVFMRQANYVTDYTITIDYVDSASTPKTVSQTYNTWNGSVAGSLPTMNFISTDLIMEQFRIYFESQIGQTGLFPDFTITRIGSTLHFEADTTETITSVTCEDGTGDTSLQPVHLEVARVGGWLPENASDGFKVKVIGDAEVDGDDYWVVFETDDPTGFGEGTWKETIGPGVKTTFDPDDMPHILVSTATDTFEWRQPDWAERTVGDDDSNPAPSFVDAKINGLMFYKNRLGFLSGENVILSETGEYFNFWRVSTLSLRDTARIDVASAHTKVSIFRNAVPFGGDVLLFTDRSQFALRGDEILSPRTVQLPPVAEFEASTEATPVATGRSVFFPFARGGAVGVRELFQVGDGTRYQGAEATIQIPNYIGGECRHMTGSTLENSLFILTDNQSLFAYRYQWNGQDKVQSAWGQWDFGADVLHAEQVDDEVVVVLDRNGTVTIEKLQLATGTVDSPLPWLVHLDSRVTEADISALSYSAGPNQSTFTMPYNLDTGTFAVVDRDTGDQYPVVSATGTTMVVTGDMTGLNLFIGRVYTQSYTFSKPLVRYQSGQGYATRYTDAQYVSSVRVQYSNARSFEVDVTNARRATRTKVFLVEDPDDATAVVAGEARVPVLAAADDATIEFSNDSPYPSNIMAASWDITYRPRPSKFRG